VIPASVSRASFLNGLRSYLDSTGVTFRVSHGILLANMAGRCSNNAY